MVVSMNIFWDSFPSWPAVSDLDASASVDCIAVCTLPLPLPSLPLSLFALRSRLSLHFPKELEPPAAPESISVALDSKDL